MIKILKQRRLNRTMGENLGKYDPPVDLIHGDSCPARTEAEGVIGWDECYMQIGNELYTLYCDDVAHVISQRSKVWVGALSDTVVCL